MSTFRNPVGPQSSTVYWRRRLAVLAILIAAIVVVVLIVSRLGSGAAEPAASPSAAPATVAETPAASAAPVVEGAPCDPALVAVTAIGDRNSYAAGELPQLSFSITNTGSVSCTFNVGTTQQVFRITSGSDVYWASTDCLTEPVDSEVTLEPNLSITSTPLGWDRTRSSVDTCGTDRPSVPAGGATYNLDVAVGAVEAATPFSFLLN